MVTLPLKTNPPKCFGEVKDAMNLIDKIRAKNGLKYHRINQNSILSLIGR